MLKSLSVRIMNFFYSFRDDEKPRLWLTHPAKISGILITDWGGDPQFWICGSMTEALRHAKQILKAPDEDIPGCAVDLRDSGNTLDDFPLSLIGEHLEPLDAKGRLIASPENWRATYRIEINTGRVCFSDMKFGKESEYEALFSNPVYAQRVLKNPLAVKYVESILALAKTAEAIPA
jgi:hypothetical protein